MEGYKIPLYLQYPIIATIIIWIILCLIFISIVITFTDIGNIFYESSRLCNPIP